MAVFTRSSGSLLLALALTGVGLGSLGHERARADDAKPRKGQGSTGADKVALLELFVSQGCSSCPPAEEFVGALAANGFPRRQVVALAYHVDYWDRLGWKDPFSSERWTERQKDVARALKQDSYYTPELVWDGRGHSSNPSEATTGLKRALGTKARAQLSLDATLEANKITVKGSATPAKGEVLAKGLVLHVLVLEDDLETEVPRGENSGRKLHETAVVRDLAVAATLDAERREALPFEAAFIVPDSWHRDSLHVVATLRDPKSSNVWQALDVSFVTSAS